MPDAVGVAPGLADLLADISRLQGVMNDWPAEQRNLMTALSVAQDALQAEAWRRLLRGLRDVPEATGRLRDLAGDEVVYAVLRHHGLVKASLNERIEEALQTVRPMLHGHGGDVELVSISPPDRVAVRLTGACDGCPASAITLAAGVEQAIRQACPEIKHIDTQPGSGAAQHAEAMVSPFSQSGDWQFAAPLAAIPEAGLLRQTVADQPLLFSRRAGRVSCFDDACSHMGLPLGDGAVEDGILRCPHHGFAYSLQDGSCITAPGVTLIAHPARVVGARVEVRLR